MVALLRSNPKYNLRAAIIEILVVGRTPSVIIRFFGYYKSTVYDIASGMRPQGSPERDILIQ